MDHIRQNLKRNIFLSILQRATKALKCETDIYFLSIYLATLQRKREWKREGKKRKERVRDKERKKKVRKIQRVKERERERKRERECVWRGEREIKRVQ